MDSEWLQASADIVNFRAGRKTGDRTHRNPVSFSEIVDVALRDVGQPLVVDQVTGLRIQQHTRRDSLVQQFKGASGTNVGFPSQHHNGVGFFRMVDHQKARGLARQPNQNQKHDEES